MIRTLVFRVLAAATLAVLAAGFISMREANAAELRRSLVVDSDVVTLGDLYEGAGDLASTPVFRAPELGVNGALPVSAALAAAKAAGLDVAAAPNFNSVSVVRRSVELSADAFRRLIASAAAARLGVALENVGVSFETEPSPMVADASAHEPAAVDGFTLQPGSGRFVAAINVDVGNHDQRLELRGRAFETVNVPVLVRPIARTDIINPDDVTMSRLESRFVSAGAAIALDEVVGMAARRPLRAGEAILSADIEAPKLVTRGDTVTLVFNKPGLALSARGKALGDGAKGSVVSVLNEQSRRTIQAVVLGAGLVEVGSISVRPTVLATIKN